MKLKLTAFVLFAALAFIACKKEDKQPTTPTNTSGGAVNSNNPTPSSATSFYGFFSTSSYSSASGPGPSPMYISNSVRAYFYSTPQPWATYSAAVTVSNVAFNGSALSFTPNYYQNQGSVSLSSETWSVTGANGIPSFTVTNPNTRPTISGLSNLPFAISKSIGVTISGIAISTGTASIVIMDGSSSPVYIEKALSVGSNTVNFSGAELAGMSTASYGFIMVSVSNDKAYKIAGTDFEFSQNSTYSHTIDINP